ncbi:Tn3 family transposase [Streptomyces sp. NBC_01077]|uniref:Tn3 family transposase n=1 Tax=Streptomyces sp. NBC_01077 TaxID=2903746 RepID=UPI0038638F3F
MPGSTPCSAKRTGLCDRRHRLVPRHLGRAVRDLRLPSSSSRIADIGNACLWRTHASADYGPLQEAAGHTVRLDRVRGGTLRVAVSLTTGEVCGYGLIRMVYRDGRPTGLGDTFTHYGRLFKTLHLVLATCTTPGLTSSRVSAKFQVVSYSWPWWCHSVRLIGLSSRVSNQSARSAGSSAVPDARKNPRSERSSTLNTGRRPSRPPRARRRSARPTHPAPCFARRRSGRRGPGATSRPAGDRRDALVSGRRSH